MHEKSDTKFRKNTRPTSMVVPTPIRGSMFSRYLKKATKFLGGQR